MFAAALIALSFAIGRFKLPPMSDATHHEHAAGKEASLWQYRHLVLGAVAIFTYVGAEVSIGSFLINYLTQHSIGDISELTASRYVSYYWGGAMVGRFIGSAILQKVRTGTVLGIAAGAAALLVCVCMLSLCHIGKWGFVFVSLCISFEVSSLLHEYMSDLQSR